MMKPLLFIISLVLLLPMSANEEKSTPVEKIYRHLVIVQFKDGTEPAKIQAIEKEFIALQDKIETITDFEWGTDISPENKALGFTHCFIVTFEDQAGLDTYLPHPAHEEFVKFFRPYIEKVLVFDFVPQD